MWPHNKWIRGTKLTYFEGEFLLKIWGDSFLWLTAVKTITREFLSGRKRSFEVFIDNIRLPSFIYYFTSCKCWGCMFVEFGSRPWSSRGAHSSQAPSVVCSLGRVGAVAEAVGRTPLPLNSADLGVNYCLWLWEADKTSQCFPSCSLKLRQKEIAVNA